MTPRRATRERNPALNCLYCSACYHQGVENHQTCPKCNATFVEASQIAAEAAREQGQTNRKLRNSVAVAAVVVGSLTMIGVGKLSTDAAKKQVAQAAAKAEELAAQQQAAALAEQQRQMEADRARMVQEARQTSYSQAIRRRRVIRPTYQPTPEPTYAQPNTPEVTYQSSSQPVAPPTPNEVFVNEFLPMSGDTYGIPQSEIMYSNDRQTDEPLATFLSRNGNGYMFRYRNGAWSMIDSHPVFMPGRQRGVFEE